MSIENRWKNQSGKRDLMGEEDLESWIKYLSGVSEDDDPMELLGRNKGRNKKEIILRGDGPDDEDSL